MTQFLPIATLLMSFVSFLFMLLVTFVSPLGQSKSFYFLCGESAFITAIIFGALSVHKVHRFNPFETILWFIVGSIMFAYSAWFTN